MAINGMTRQDIASILRQRHILPTGIIDSLVQQAEVTDKWLGRVIVDHALLTEGELAQILAEQQGFEVIDLTRRQPDVYALGCLSVDRCRAHSVVPVRLQHNALLLAVVNPLDSNLDNLLAGLRQYQITLAVAPLSIIEATIERWYRQLPTAPASVAATLPPAAEPDARAEIHELLGMVIQYGGSDLHLSVGMRPLVRVDGVLQPLSYPVLSSAHAEALINSILTEPQQARFAERWELDTAYILPNVARFRVNVFRQSGQMGAVFRAIPMEVPTLEKLQMPPVIRDLAMRARGLVLVTGPTGTGKSTTLAAMVEEVNRTRRAHIMTVEDPIEFVYQRKCSEVNQRQIGTDTKSFADALRHVLRQDPDIILIGEMRDQETISAAITAAETGHLVFSTLHTVSAVQTIDRIVDVFPPHQQNQIRTQLANVLEGIVSQLLIPSAEGHGRVCAQEILLATAAVRNLIREAKIHLIPSVIQASSKCGMQLMDQVLTDLLRARRINLADAAAAAEHPEDFLTLTKP